jgi:polyisoprenoid-binding protein YceI
MFRKFAIAAVIAFALVGVGASKPSSYAAGSWQVDTRHSDVQLITDATTDYGKTKMNITLGFGRVNGTVIFDDSDPAKSRVDLRFYPATSMLPPIAEDGKFRNLWLANSANHTLVCFHSKSVTKTNDGKLQATGTMVLTRVDRSIEADPGEGYAGPVYGPPIVHRISHEMTLVFDPPAAQGSNQKDATLESASTKVFREDFPQLLKAVVATYWPPVVQDKSCQPVNVGEDYHGIPCTGTVLEAPGFPEPPHAGNGEDIGAAEASDFNAVVGERLNILLHMRLLPTNPGLPAAGN